MAKKTGSRKNSLSLKKRAVVAKNSSSSGRRKASRESCVGKHFAVSNAKAPALSAPSVLAIGPRQISHFEKALNTLADRVRIVADAVYAMGTYNDEVLAILRSLPERFQERKNDIITIQNVLERTPWAFRDDRHHQSISSPYARIADEGGIGIDANARKDGP